MKRFLLAYLWILMIPVWITAQESPDGMAAPSSEAGHPCQLHPVTEQLIRSARISAVQGSSRNTIFYIPVSIHLVGSDQGTGYYPIQSVMESLCQLNRDFKDYQFYFYLAEAFDYIENTDFFDMDEDYGYSDAMNQFLSEHNTDSTMNLYITNQTSPEGGSSYLYVPIPDTIDTSIELFYTVPPEDHVLIIRKIHLHNFDHLFTHEVGHYFFLLHPFHGWHTLNYSDLTGAIPDIIFGEFEWKDSLYVFPYPVERADGSNCKEAGDFICDTAPDYLSFDWQCNADQESRLVQVDPQGNSFRSDGSLYMSYSERDCHSRFSEEQWLHMRYSAETLRPYLFYDQSPPPDFEPENLDILFPAPGEAVAVRDSVTLQWAISGGMYYHVQLGFSNDGSFFPLVERSVATTNLTLPVEPNREYTWRITAYGPYHPCGFTQTSTFSTYDLNEGADGLQLHPNPATAELILYFKEPDRMGEELDVHLFDSGGRLVAHWQNPVGRSIEVGDLAAGVYTVRVSVGASVFVEKLVKW